MASIKLQKTNNFKKKSSVNPVVKVDLKTQWQSFLKIFSSFVMIGGDLI